MKPILRPILMATMIALSGCAVGPLALHETARTVGNSNHELDLGYGRAGYAFKWNYGLSENWDLGFQLESLSVGLRTKYAFWNNEKGWSLALAAGTGFSIGGKHYYGDLIGSYKNGSVEPYSAFRVVRVKTDPLEFKDKETGYIDFSFSSEVYSYGQYILGLRCWISPHWIFSLEGSYLFSTSSDLDVRSTSLVSGVFGYHF